MRHAASRAIAACAVSAALLAATVAAAPAGALRLSYVPQEPAPAPGAPSPDAPLPGGSAPGGPPGVPADPHAPDSRHDHGPAGDATSVPAAPGAALSDVRYGTDGLPEPVAATRRALLGAARTGEIEALRPIFERQRVAPLVAPDMAGAEPVADPVDHLRRQSGDDEGREILAILTELLETGHVKVGEGSATTYVWPYFAEVPLADLTPRHHVELYRILTAIDVEEIARQGRYTFFRVGIAPDGRVRYFTAGDVE